MGWNFVQNSTKLCTTLYSFLFDVQVLRRRHYSHTVKLSWVENHALDF